MIDPLLIGNWYGANRSIEFRNNAIFEELKAAHYLVDTQTGSLKLGTDQLGLTFGDGNSIFGVWSRRSLVGTVVNYTATTILPNYKYSTIWFADNELMEMSSGRFDVTGSRIGFYHLVGKVLTEPPGTIIVSGAYTKDAVGIYNIEPDGKLILTLDGIEEIFTRHFMGINPNLVGLWAIGPQVYKVDTDGWFLLQDGPRGFTVSPDGLTLTLEGEISTPPFDRVFGAGQDLLGVWNRTIFDQGDTFVEEVTFRSDSSQSNYWTKNGTFMSSSSGTFGVANNSLTRFERYALILTAVPDLIQFHKSPDPDETGTYVLSPDLSVWTVSTNGINTSYQRIL